MGYEVINDIMNMLNSLLHSVSSSGIPKILAYTGLAILLVIAFSYLGVAIVKGFRKLFNLTINKFVAAMALTGFALILIAVLLP